MKLGRITAGLFVIGAFLGAGSYTCAEEITLKDGQKIVGTIVGYEKDMFRVETDYGIALVRKDKVASIQVTKPESTSPPTPAPPATKTLGAKPARVATVPEPSPAPAPPPPTPAKPSAPAPVVVAPAKPSAPTPVVVAPAHVAAVPEPAPAPAPPAPAKPPAPAPVVVTPAKPPAPPPPPVSHPLDAPMPAHLQEHVDGTTYFSDTFQFSMFKPPDWKIYEGVPKETGSGIMAMGTEDEQTLLIVDRQVWSGTPKLTSDQVEAKLRQTYEEYRRISEESVECDGQTATRRSFTGVMDGAEWHGVAVHVIHGSTVFGIIGLTSAETFQFQEAIFNKVIRTFHFLSPATPTAAPLNP
jgi:hypothetical protein